MIHFLMTVIAGLLIALTGTIVIFKTSRKKGTDEEEKLARIRKMYPNDPDFSQDSDNRPDWKPKQSQAN